MGLLALEEELVHALHTDDRVAGGQVIVEGAPGEAEAVDRFVAVEEIVELVEQHVGEGVLGEGCLVIGILEQVEQVVGRTLGLISPLRL